jgi:hypothetical protein
MPDAVLRRLLWEVRVLRVLVLALAVGGVSLAARQGEPNDGPLVTTELTVKRADKTESLVLGTEPKPRLELRDEKGRVRVRLSMMANEPAMIVYDENGKADNIFDPKPRVRQLTQ